MSVLSYPLRKVDQDVIHKSPYAKAYDEPGCIKVVDTFRAIPCHTTVRHSFTF